jgi:AcrR family transcriptional regulator
VVSDHGSPAVGGSGGRAQRADARTNRIRVLDAAEQVFGRGGESASTEEVARLAGVGIATVFRHFPTKAELLEAVLTRRFERLSDQAQELAGAADPGRAFFGFFAHMVADASSKIAIAEALADAGGDAPGSAERASDALERAVGVLLERAQQAGAVRNDIGLPEVYALLIGSSRAALAHLDEDVQARALAIVFDGLSGTSRAAGGSAGKRTGDPGDRRVRGPDQVSGG